MAAEHEAYEACDDAHGDSAPADALMAAILGEPLPPGSAEAADVAVLREQLRTVGRVLSEPPPPPPGPAVPAGPAAPASRRRPGAGRPPRPASPAHPARLPRPPRRSRHLALGAVAVACAGVFLAGTAWLVTQTQGGAGDTSTAAGSQADSGAEKAVVPFGSPAYLACARLVAEGTVTGAGPASGEGGRSITVEITRQYAPDEVSREVTFLTEEGADAPGVGDRVLFGLPAHGVHPDALFTGEAEIAPVRARVTAALPESRTLTCE